MKVLIVTNWYPTERNPVAGVFVKEFAEAVSKYCDVVVLHPEPSENVKMFKIRKTSNNFKVIKLMYRAIGSSSLSYVLSSFLAILWMVKNIKKFAPDVIHAHNYLAAVWAIIAGRIYGIPVIITEHGLHKEGDDYKDYLLKSVRLKIKNFIAKIIFNSADYLIFVSRASRDHISQTLGVLKPNSVISNVLNENFLKIKKIISNNYNNKKIILFIGGLNPRKGVNYLLEAAKILKRRRSDFIIKIVGYGPFEGKYRKLAKELGVDDVVEFLGRVNDNIKIELLKSCDVFVLPSLFENFGIVLIEAMACGKPVVTTSSGGQVEFVNDRCGKIVPPKDPLALANAIEDVLENLDRYSNKEISYYVKKMFNPITVGKMIYKTYKQVIYSFNNNKK